jgi:small-conductance mechanosensitive channel
VRGLQQNFATREEQLDRLAQDLELNNRDLESALDTMRQVLAQHRVQLAQAQASGDKSAITRERERATGSVAIMNKTVEAASQRQALLGEARSLMAVTNQQANAPINTRYQTLANRITAMRSITNTLVLEIL